MPVKAAVAGGTGTVGRLLVEALRRDGHEVAVLARSAGVDLRDDQQVAAALRGVDVVFDVANVATSSAKKATPFFTEVTGRLSRLGADAGASRLVVLSIVGIDRASAYGYYKAKLAQEEVARFGPLPASIVRATQFHEFAGQILERTRFGPLAVVPVMRVQTVAAGSVAEYLSALVREPVPAPIAEIAGPEQADLVVALARATLRNRHQQVAVLALPLPGPAGKAMRAGALLPGAEAPVVGPTFQAWLAERPERLEGT
ncbi:MAG: SDR family oxidoreductase [Acidimicrobiales bacterium]